MFDSWAKYKSFYTLIFFLLLSLVIMTFYGRGLDQRAIIDRVILEMIAPTHMLTTSIVHWVRDTWDGYICLVGVRQENKLLKHQVAELEAINNHFLEIEKENQRLKALLEFRKTLPNVIISAQIIGKDATSWFRSILLNKGENDGVMVNQPVVTHQGLVGKVVRTTPSTSQVELITDKNSRVAALIQKNRAESILCGQSSPVCVLEYLSRDVDIQAGDCVISSGMGGIFPKGLMLGVISKVGKKSYGLFQYAEVTPLVPFSMLEEVLILKTVEEPPFPGTPPGQGDDQPEGNKTS
ncbi:MAG: rod shape-determining protein MreC [bacterium]